jgi:serine/threonine-protein kinase
LALSSGTRLGSFEIVERIGAGGMGEVYRATDSKLGRYVAIKTLPASLAQDADRLARLEREAKLLASLNHAHIAAVHSLDEHDGTLYIAMELVEGETLESRLKAGPLSVDDSLQIALQIASALEAAHEKGVVHRDLKPANVMVTQNGVVKVLDFGLAKAFSGDPNEASPGHSPALSMAMTQQGLILGTAGYMSPEQASGQATDQRADIWAFGVVLYEMLTGQPLFSGESVPHILAAVLRLEPDWDRLPAKLHPRLGRVLARCLKKKPRERYHSIADVRIDIEEIAADPEGAKLEAARPETVARRPIAGWIAAAVATTAVLAVAAAWTLWPDPPPRSLMRFDYDVPESLQFRIAGRPIFALSRDGRRFVVNTGQGLYLREMSDLEARPIPGTEAVLTNPFFSPDGQSVAYFSPADVAFKRISISGGAPVLMAAGVDNPFGASWGGDGMILAGQTEGVVRFPASGGEPEIVVAAEPGERLHGPELLPDGDSILFSATTTNWDAAEIAVASLATGERTILLRGGSDARYLPSGHLVYAREDDLFAVPFDLATLSVTGGAQPLVQGLVRAGNLTAAANYGIADDGTLAYVSGGTLTGNNVSLVWTDRDGSETDVGMAPCDCFDLALSPDGTRVAVAEFDPERGESDIWIWSFGERTRTRLTFEMGVQVLPVWRPDSRGIVYTSGGEGILERAADGTGSAELLLEWGTQGFGSFGIDGNGDVILVGPGDLVVLKLSGDGAAQLLATGFVEDQPELSPDGRWLAYQSDESGRPEIYVRPYPDVDAGKWQISDGGGTEARWSPDGSRLYFLGATEMMATEVELEPAFRRQTPTPLFALDAYDRGGVRNYDLGADGERFLMRRRGASPEATQQARVVIVQNWVDELERVVPTR